MKSWINRIFRFRKKEVLENTALLSIVTEEQREVLEKMCSFPPADGRYNLLKELFVAYEGNFDLQLALFHTLVDIWGEQMVSTDNDSKNLKVFADEFRDWKESLCQVTLSLVASRCFQHPPAEAAHLVMEVFNEVEMERKMTCLYAGLVCLAARKSTPEKGYIDLVTHLFDLFKKDSFPFCDEETEKAEECDSQGDETARLSEVVDDVMNPDRDVTQVEERLLRSANRPLELSGFFRPLHDEG